MEDSEETGELMELIEDMADLVRTQAYLRKRQREDTVPRGPSLFRRRWDMDYFVTLAGDENSFIREYRMDVSAFFQLHAMLKDHLCINTDMARLRQKGTNSDFISTESRLGAALIILSGGRRIESMRTHGLSATFVNDNLHRVVDAIIACPDLEIKPRTDIASLEKTSRRFAERRCN